MGHECRLTNKVRECLLLHDVFFVSEGVEVELHVSEMIRR